MYVRPGGLASAGKLGDERRLLGFIQERALALTALQRTALTGFPSGSCAVLLTYQLDGSVTDMLW